MNETKLSGAPAFAAWISRRLSRDDSGQILIMSALWMTVMLGMLGLTLDVGKVYLSFHNLQASSDAAAMAGASELPETTATTTATSYASTSGSVNQSTLLGTVTMSTGFPRIVCLSTYKNQNLPCSAPGNGNAVQVKQQVSVPLWFGQFFGVHSVSIAASATAIMAGSAPKPYNVAIILDTTASMGSSGSDSCTYTPPGGTAQTGTTRLACAKFGIQALLSSLSPCSDTLTSCSPNASGVATDPVDQVALFVFPNVTVGTAANDYTSPCSNPSVPVYSFPTTTSTSYNPTGSSTATYQITPYLSNYRASDSVYSLTTSSNLSATLGLKSGCGGVAAPGGDGTYYAGALWAAQASLLAQDTASGISSNIIILLSDGAANSTKMATKMTDGTTNVATSGSTYPSTVQQCQQAVGVASAIKATGTTIYTISYGASTATSGQCSTDTNGISPCSALQQIATSGAYFFSDYTATGGDSGCTSVNSVTGLSDIFSSVGNKIGQGSARLVPDSTT